VSVTGASASPASALPAIKTVDAARGTRLDVADADWVALADGWVWTTLASGSVQQLDSSTGASKVAVPVLGEMCTAMDVGFGSLWVPACFPASVKRIDPATGRVLAEVAVEGENLQEEGSIAADEDSGAVWAVTTLGDLIRIDVKTNRVVGKTKLPDGVVAVRAGLGGLWATNPDEGELLKLDPRTGSTLDTIQVGAGARFFDVGEGAVWVQNNIDGTVSRVDPATAEVVATIVVDDEPISGGDLAVGGGFVWARVTSSLVAQIDPVTNTVVARFGEPEGSGSVAADDEAVWISAHDVDAVYRIPLP
jgi:streptogramin lyase